MKTLIGQALGVLLLLLLSYLAVAWINWELDPSVWGAPSRVLVLMLLAFLPIVRWRASVAQLTPDEE